MEDSASSSSAVYESKLDVSNALFTVGRIGGVAFRVRRSSQLKLSNHLPVKNEIKF